MRLYNTLSRQLEELPAPPGPDPDVLLRADRLPARAHRQRAPVRARHVAARLAAAPRLRRDARPQHHRRQRQDLRRRAGRERRARGARDRVVPRGHRRPRARAARRAAEGDRAHPGDRRASSRSCRARQRVRGRGRRLLPRRERSRLRPAVGPAARPGGGAGAEPAEGGPARLRALEGEEAAARTRRGTRRGAAAGPAGTSSAR